jgi:hypothetical protein
MVEKSFLYTAHLLSEIYLPMKFHVDISKASWVMLWTKIKFEKKQRAITEKLYRVELSILSSALLLNMIYVQVDILNTFFFTFFTPKGGG